MVDLSHLDAGGMKPFNLWAAFEIRGMTKRMYDE